MKQFQALLLLIALFISLVVAESLQESAHLTNDECLQATRHDELSLTERNTTHNNVSNTPSFLSTDNHDDDDSDTRLSYNVVDWVVENGGYFNPKQAFRRDVETDDTTIVASSHISKGEVLAKIPWKCVLTANTDSYDSELFCNTTFLLVNELNKGNDSFYAPYTTYLQANPPRITPSTYSENGKELFQTILGKNQLPPQRATRWIDRFWIQDCGGSKKDQDTVMSMVSRGDDDVLVPLYDFYNHGNFENARTVVKQDEYFLVKAKRNIYVGQEILLSYNQCSNCGNRILTYGTPELFREYGFIEQFPQRWIFHDQEIAFDIEKEESGELEVTFLDDDVSQAFDNLYQVTEWGIDILQAHLERLSKLNETTIQPLLEQQSLPQDEMDSIMSFYNALMHALELGVEAAKDYEYIVWNDKKPKKKKKSKKEEKKEYLYAPHVAEAVAPGELSLLKWQDTNSVIDPYAAQVGLPEKLVPTVKAYANKLGIFDIVKDFLYNDPCEPKHGRFYHIPNPFVRNDTTTLSSTNDDKVLQWYTQRPGDQWQSDMHWFAPSNEQTHEITIQMLREGGFDEVLEAIGSHYDLDALAIQSAGFLAVTHCEEGYLHTDFKNVEGKVFNFLIPLHSPENAEEELRVVGERIKPNVTDPEDEEEVKVETKIKYNEKYGVLVGDGTWHGTRECDHRPTGDIRIVFSVYLVDLVRPAGSKTASSMIWIRTLTLSFPARVALDGR